MPRFPVLHGLRVPKELMLAVRRAIVKPLVRKCMRESHAGRTPTGPSPRKLRNFRERFPCM